MDDLGDEKVCPSAHHPRRPPSHESVSLRHGPSSSRPSPAPASDQANPPSTISPTLNAHKQSSGESSDAGHWFEKTNNNAFQGNTFPDNDPPFFLRNSSSSGTPPEGHEFQSTHMLPRSTIMAHRPGMSHRDTDGSSTQDFRSVIDDLTIANKKLKQKLRKYEKLYDAHLQDEKLFEVRFHRLPDHKKKELEEHLRKFAADLDGGPDAGYAPISYAPLLAAQKSSYSHTSRVAESGYASLSASGQNSTSAPLGQEHDHHKMTKSQYNQQQQSIRSYLHDIPAGLLPRRNAPMSEKSKKKLVVRRLEQIFAGKRSAPGSHPQPMQQEEVAQSAAMADRREKEATGQRSKLEGLREARIMPSHPEDDVNVLFSPPEVLPKGPGALIVHDHELAGSGSPDQRPTRPLDLDPYRAQVPAENIQYIRHLGFTPPDMASGEAPEEGHGWLYLNLLINMAQLHTINVTPDFVKEAVSEFSSKFELSHDGRKIRWRGDQDMTMGGSDSSSEQLGDSPYGLMSGLNPLSPLRRPKYRDEGLTNESVLELEQQARRVARAAKKKEQGKFAYEPLFFHKDDTDDEDDFYNLDTSSSNNSPFPAQQRGDSSGFTSSILKSSSSRKRRDGGPIIFYNKAKFCTDLSGDGRDSMTSYPAMYRTVAIQPMGAIQPVPTSTRVHTDISEPRGPLDDAMMDMDQKEGEKTSSGEDLGWSPDSLRNDTSSDSVDIMDFEASGLGGVQPDDNFAIKVRRSQVQTAPSFTARAQRHELYRYPKKILDALEEQPLLEGEHPRRQPNVIKEEIISASRKSLPHSTLPPASFLPFDSTSSYDIDSDSDANSDVSSSPSSSNSESEPEPTTALGLLNLAAPTRIGPVYAVPSEPSPSETDSSSDNMPESDGSLDFLATARKLDPKTVLASEREYDAAVADRLAEEIPAGSSAATAGGGSGFNTPEGMEVIQKDIQSGGTKQLKRTRTSDSMTAMLQKQKLLKKD